MKDIENNEVNKDHILSDPLSYKPMIPPNIMTYDNPERESLSNDLLEEDDSDHNIDDSNKNDELTLF